MAPKAFKRSDRRHSTRQTMVVRSLRAYRHSRQVHVKTGNLGEVDPFVYARCIQTIFPIDGRPKPLTPWHGDRVHRAGHVRPALGADLGALFRVRHEAAGERIDIRFLRFEPNAEEVNPRCGDC